MAQHNSLSSTDLHENKGVDSAADNTVASSTSHATVWRKVNANMVDATSIFQVNKARLTTFITSVSTAETVYLTVPFAGVLNTVYTVLQATIATANDTITVKNNAGATAGTITIPFAGSNAGDKTTTSITTNNTFAAGDTLSIATGGGSTNTAKLFLTLVFTVTG